MLVILDDRSSLYTAAYFSTIDFRWMSSVCVYSTHSFPKRVKADLHRETALVKRFGDAVVVKAADSSSRSEILLLIISTDSQSGKMHHT